MTVHVYVGPTLGQDEVRRELPGAAVFGPASFGDVFRSVEARARCIAIIDGYFERVPPVWHKEILYALSSGVHVFGSSSMGALRAAELDAFGMRGVGVAYDAFRTGTLEDDDEVTIAHASADESYRPLSEAMLNVRATVAAAATASIISDATARELIAVTKRHFYGERSYSATLRDAASNGASASELERFRAWLPVGRVDQKAADARALLSQLKEWLGDDPAAFRPSFRFERTDAWARARSVAEAEGGAALNAMASSQDGLEEELKLAGMYRAALERGAARARGLEDARRAGFHPDARAVGHAAETLRRQLGLIDRRAFEAWCTREGFERESLVRFFADEARIAWAQPRSDVSARDQLVSGLRATGRYGEFAARVTAKTRWLSALGPRGPSLDDVRMSEPELWQWYFTTRLTGEVPPDLDCFARESGFKDKDDLRAALLREAYCLRAEGQREPGRSATNSGP